MLSLRRTARAGARVLAAALLALVVWPLPASDARGDLPQRLTDQEFWQLSTDLSEPEGSFSSDNLVSNEDEFPKMAAALRARGRLGGVYLGVGPEQNFTYIAAVRPRIAIVVDIRRNNLRLQLLYKALFELSADRAEFVSRLFTKKRPDGLRANATATQIVEAYWAVYTSDEASFRANLAEVFSTLTERHRFPLTEQDRTGIEHIYHSFYWNGPRITWNARAWPPTPAEQPSALMGMLQLTWADLMMRTDESGTERGFLTTEETYRVVKELQERNLVVPVVGDFAGPKAIRAVGDYIRERGAFVNTFYTSNVEGVLQSAGKRKAFCANAATLPMDDASVLVRMFRMMPVSGPYEPGTVIRYSAGGARSITINGRDLPASEVAAYFAQPTSAVLDMKTELKRCESDR